MTHCITFLSNAYPHTIYERGGKGRVNPLSADPTKWLNTVKEFACFFRRTV